jgi:hypothetical protein
MRNLHILHKIRKISQKVKQIQRANYPNGGRRLAVLVAVQIYVEVVPQLVV